MESRWRGMPLLPFVLPPLDALAPGAGAASSFSIRACRPDNGGKGQSYNQVGRGGGVAKVGTNQKLALPLFGCILLRLGFCRDAF